MKSGQRTVSLTPVLKKLVPICFAIGMGMEAFMVKTGFYDIVTKSAAEKRQTRQEEVRAWRNQPPPELKLNWPGQAPR